MTVKELSRFLKKHPNTIRNWISIGAVKAIKIGRDWVIPQDEVDKIRVYGVTIPARDNADT